MIGKQRINEIELFWNHTVDTQDDVVHIREAAKEDIELLIDEIKRIFEY